MKTRLLLSSLLIALSATSFAQTHKAKRIGLIMGKKALNIGVICSPSIKPVS